MSILVALILAQSLNLNNQPIMCMDEAAYCRADRLRAFELNCSGAGITCTQVGGRMTMTVPGGGGSGGGAPVDGGYLTITAGSTGSTNEVVLTAGTSISITPGAGIATVAVTSPVATASALAANPTDCGANQYANTIAANGNLTCAQVAYSQVSGTPTIPTDISGAGYWTKTAEANLSNEFAMGGLTTGLVVNTTTTGVPTIKGTNTCTNQFPRSDNASGTWTCASIATADLPTVPVTKGGTNLTTIAANQVWTGTAADTVTVKTLPSCSAASSALTFNNATQTWGCNTITGGTDPLTTKGDLHTFSTVSDRLPTSTDGLCLKTNSATGTGLEWASCGAAGSGITYAEAAAASLAGF